MADGKKILLSKDLFSQLLHKTFLSPKDKTPTSDVASTKMSAHGDDRTPGFLHPLPPGPEEPVLVTMTATL